MRSINIIFAVLLYFLIFLSCTIDKPVLPRWTTHILVPLVKEKIEFAERFANDSTIVVKGDSLFLELTGDFDADTLTSADLSLPGADSTTHFSLETIKLDSLNTISTGQINIIDIFPSLNSAIGMTVPIPDTTIQSEVILNDSSAFKSMKVKNGTVILTMYNNLPITIAPHAPSASSMDIAVYDVTTGAHITDISITDTIPPGGSASGIGTLGEGDGWIHIPLRLNYQVHILADTIAVTQSALDSWNFRVDLSFRNLEVEEITGRVTSQTFEDNLHIGVEQKDRVVEAVVDSGSIDLKFFNQLPIIARITYTLPDIINPNTQQPLRKTLEIQPNDSSIFNIQDLHGYRILNSQAPGQPLDTLTLITQASSDTGYVTLRETDEIAVRVRVSKILFSYLKGILAPASLDLDPLQVNDIIDYDGFNTGFELKGVRLILGLENGLNIENLILTGRIAGYHKDQSGFYIDSAFVDIPSEPVSFGYNTIELSGPEVDALVNILPNDLRADGTLSYSGQAEVAAGDRIAGNYFFTTPFQVSIVQATDIPLDPDTLREVDPNFREAARENIQQAQLSGKVLNAAPLDGQFQLFISRNFGRTDLYDTTANFDPSREFVKTIDIPAAQVDPVTGFVTQPVEQEFSIPMTQQEVALFGLPPLRLGLLLKLNETNGFVVLRGSDYVEFSGNIVTELLIKDNSHEYK
jgi:hypothetical protein